MLSWADFKHEFEIRYYSAQYQWNKEYEFFNLKQLDISVMDYERRFQSLSTFASVLIPTKHHKIGRFKEGLTQELKKGLITYQRKTLRELVEAAQALEAVLKVDQRDMTGQGQIAVGKRKVTVT